MLTQDEAPWGSESGGRDCLPKCSHSPASRILAPHGNLKAITYVPFPPSSL